MKKVNLVIIGLLMLLSLPMMTAVYGASSGGQILDVNGNTTCILYFNMTTTQMTTNPGVGDNVSYYTEVMVTTNETYFNMTDFLIQLPDNRSVPLAVNVNFSNSSRWNENKSGTNLSALWVNTTNYLQANLSSLASYCIGASATGLGCANRSTFIVYWIMSDPITSTKITATRAGRVWTETWNVTSAASNVTIENVSLLAIPSYWYSKIGNPTAVTFNGTALTGYISNYSSIEPFTDLNLSSNGNLLVYGSGYQTLSISYNGPSIDSSSGSSPSTAVSVVPTTAREVSLYVIIILSSLIAIGGVVFLVVKLRKG